MKAATQQMGWLPWPWEGWGRMPSSVCCLCASASPVACRACGQPRDTPPSTGLTLGKSPDKEREYIGGQHDEGEG